VGEGNVALHGKHHQAVEPGQSVGTNTLPKHLLNRHLTSLARGGIIDQTGRRREGPQFDEAVCLAIITTYNKLADGQVRSLFPRQVR
jgi:hypothetical protein